MQCWRNSRNSLVPVGVARGEHPALAGGDDLARMKGKTGDIAVGLADPFPAVANANLAADGARGILNDRQAMTGSDGQNPAKVAGQANLMHAENGPGTLGDRGFEPGGIEIEGLRQRCPRTPATRRNNGCCSRSR